IETIARRDITVEIQCRVGIGEVQVGTDLDRPITIVDDNDRLALTALVQLYRSFANTYLAGNHTIGSVIVTSLRPSGNVASTCTSDIISGTPSITSSRERIRRPSFIRCATEAPSRARSIAQHEINAVASG